MGSRSIWGWLCGCGLALGLVAMPSFAAAQDCTSDGDCDPGFVCTSFGTVDCAYACPDGQTCPDMPPDCMPMELKGCSPAPCTDDSGCPDGMVCFAQPTWECPPVAELDCPPGAECPKPTDPPECTETTVSTCAPKYVPPCVEDSDCGGGFKCVESESCACGGSAGAADGSAGAGSGAEPAPAPEPTPEDTCTCTPSGEFYCELQEMPCASASECPDGFTCEANPESVVCSLPTEPAGTAGSSGGADGGVAGAEGGAAGDSTDPCGTTTAPDMVCLPPYWATGYATAASRGEVAIAAGTVGGVADDGSTATGAPGAAPNPTAGGEMSTGTSDGSGGGGGFCAVSAPGAASGSSAAGLAGLFALLGLALGRRRRVC